MELEEQVRIQKCMKTLSENVLVDDLLPHLMSDLVITVNDSEIIKHEITKRDQAMRCMQLLLSRGPRAYHSLHSALLEEYDYLAKLLERTPVSHEDLIAFKKNLLDVPTASPSPRPGRPGSPYRAPSPKPEAGFAEELGVIAHELRTYYEVYMRHTAPVPWLESFQVQLTSVYTPLQMVRALNRTARLKSEVDETALATPRDLFAPSGGKTCPRHVLIEGDPGMGKTTLCGKLLYDWATDEDNPLDKFDLVLAMRARELDPKKPLLTCLYESLLPEDFEIRLEEFKEIIKCNQERVLIIIDGFDEFMDQHMDFSKVMSYRVLSHISVLVTSRPGFTLNLLKHFDSSFVIVGYGEEQRIEFIDKFASICELKAREQFERFKMRLCADQVLSHLCRNPLHLVILCMLLEDSQTTALPQTKTELYNEMNEFIIKRACESLSYSFDDFKNKCSPLAAIAYKGLVEGRHEVMEEEVRKHCDVTVLKHLGFFCRKVTLSKFRDVVTYTFTHKSFQDYFAAKHIAAPRRTKHERLDMARELLQHGDNKYAMVFLCGLLKDNHYAVVELLDIIKDETYMPFISTESLSLHDVNENHNAHTIFHCLREVDPLPPKLGPKMLSCNIEQISLSYPWCSAECMEGIIKLCGIIDQNCIMCFTPKSRKENNNMLNYSSATTTNRALPQQLVIPERPAKLISPQYVHSSTRSGEEMRSREAQAALTAALPNRFLYEENENRTSSLPESIPKSALGENSLVSKSTGSTRPTPPPRRGSHKPEVQREKPPVNPTMNRRPKSLEGYLDDRPKRSANGYGRPRSIEDTLDREDPPRRRSTKSNIKVLFQRALVELKNNSIAASPFERARCKKFAVTVPAPLVSKRRQLFETFMKQLVDSRHVETFSMHDITTVNEVQTLFGVLARVGRPRITSLALRFLGVTDTIATSVKLDTLYFLWVQSLSIIECPSTEVLCGIINSIPNANSIRYLSFSQCSFDAASMQALCDKLQHMKCLKTFDFRQNIMSPDCADLLDLLTSIEGHQHLAHFGLSNLTAKVRTPCPNKIELFPKDDSHLTHLSPYLCHIISSNYLESIFISNSTLGSGLLGILSDAVQCSKTLRRIDLPRNLILPAGFPVLTRLLESVKNATLPSPDLPIASHSQAINIQEINLLGTELSPENYQAIADILKSSADIKTLSIGIVNIDDMDVFSHGLYHNRTLQYLEVRKIIFGGEAIVEFSQAISVHPFLQTLILSTNDMLPVKMSHLMQAIKTSSSLQNIALRHFYLEDIHMIELSHVLATNENIVKVNLQSNLIGPPGVDHLYKKLAYRSKLWKLDLSDNAAKEFHDEVKLLKTRVLYLKVNWF